MDSLPFGVDQLVETRSFQAGYRGAWFRCKIKETGQKGYGLEYFDYPDEKLRWMRVVYQKPPWKTEEKKWLMLRPQYPQVYSKDEVPDTKTLSEIIVVQDGAWKVGDLIDWFCEGAYWSGTITEIKGYDKVEIELHPRPLGEGSSYEALCKDLRPSLNWSLNSGWSLPVPQGGDNGHTHFRLIKPVGCDAKTKDAELTTEGSPDDDVSTSSCSSALPTLQNFQAKEGRPTKRSCLTTKKAKATLEAGGSSAAKRSYSDSVSTGVNSDDSNNIEEAPENGLSKRTRSSGCVHAASNDDTIESMLIELEELLCEIKSVNRMLKSPDSI